MALVTGCGTADGRVDASAGQDRPTASSTVSVPQGLRDFRSAQKLPSVPAPRRVRIPDLGVDSTLEFLDRRADKTVEVPKDWQRAGWYRDGPRPGEPGSAVILGHVDSPQGPAIFSGLAGVRAGTRVIVDRADGSSVTFRVTRVELFLRARFPVAKVYLPTLARELRLITCGGRYDRSRGGYQSNVVVFATAERRSVGG
ncbi:MAG: class F sortase [Sporichthyaceae bacterium]|nr:class F sortase [Sporichthyaceae bacterium]